MRLLWQLRVELGCDHRMLTIGQMTAHDVLGDQRRELLPPWLPPLEGPRHARPRQTQATHFPLQPSTRTDTSLALALKTGVPSYQVKDEEGRTYLLLQLPIEYEGTTLDL